MLCRAVRAGSRAGSAVWQCRGQTSSLSRPRASCQTRRLRDRSTGVRLAAHLCVPWRARPAWGSRRPSAWTRAPFGTVRPGTRRSPSQPWSASYARDRRAAQQDVLLQRVDQRNVRHVDALLDVVDRPAAAPVARVCDVSARLHVTRTSARPAAVRGLFPRRRPGSGSGAPRSRAPARPSAPPT